MNRAVLDLIETEREALAEVNDIRRDELGLGPLTALPRGIVHDYKQCPIARALGDAQVTEVAIFLHPGTTEEVGLPVPQSVERFVRMFDHGRFTHLEETP